MNEKAVKNSTQQLDDALREQRELLSVTLSSIGDAVIASDTSGSVTFLNPVAQTLTGWTQVEAVGKSLATVFRIVNEASRCAAVNPAIRALKEGIIVGLTNHTLLIARDGTEWPIEDSAAPIRNAEGNIAGVVLVFRDVTERRRREKLAEEALAYADNILATLREPFLVLDQNLRVVTANRSFYDNFHVASEETQGRFIYDLGNRQWDIPKLRTLLEDVLPQNHAFENFSVEHEFSTIGKRFMLLNARRIRKPGNHSALILLAIEDVSEQKRGEKELRQIHGELQLHADELERFNAVAVGRELRMIELKQEVNELCRQHAETARYPFEFESFNVDTAFAHPLREVATAAPPCDSLVPLESILCTEELNQRPTRPPDYEAENRALEGFAQALADSPLTILQTIAKKMLEIFQCGSAGFSLLSQDKKRFVWPAIAGVWQPHIGGGTPRDFGPCGDVLDHNAALLFQHPERRYTYFQSVTPLIEECLLVPFYVEGKVVGTIWVIAHDDRRRFDAEDVRQLQGLGRFASVAYQAMDSLRTLEQRRAAAMNLMEDAKDAAAAMQESEVRFRRLFEAAHDGILILDAATQKITHVNPFLTDLLEYPVEHFLGKELWEIGFLRDKDASRSAMRQLNERGEIRYESLPLEDSHGCLHPVEMVANVYQEGSHQVVQCNIRDISIRNRLEKLLRGQAAELSDLHRRKDEFLAMLSHELRSPLAPIANALQLLGLQRGNENRIQQQARGIIERQMGQLQHLVDDLLEVSRITTGRVQLRREPVDVGDIVAGAVETARPLIGQRRHELTVSLPPEAILLNADAARLEQVLVNLLTNAAKYTEEGGHIWLTVEQASGELASSQECVLRVRDTGVGIAAALLPRIFDLFTQAERSLDRSQGGLGIGLALVHRLTELHGGTVHVESTLGQGSEFIVRLPLMLKDTPQPELLPGETVQPATRPLRVLVVDDNTDTVLTFAILLKASGHDVRTANDGPSGVEAAIAYRPDVALLDIGLPGLNGYEVAKRMRQEPSLQNAVLVALTGYGQESDRETSRLAGFNHHLVKPANFDKLQQILATVADQLT